MTKSLMSESIRAKNGKWKEFNKHGILIAEGVYVNNRKHGHWKEYYDHTGVLMIEEYYKHGIQHGRFTSYHPNGQIYSTGLFVNGSRQGHFNVYNENGSKIKVLSFDKNELIESVDVDVNCQDSEMQTVHNESVGNKNPEK